MPRQIKLAAVLLLVTPLFSLAQSESKPGELVKLAESLTRAAREGNREPFEKLRIPNPDSWFAGAFGDRAGPHLARIYALTAPEMPAMVHERFLELSSQASLEFAAGGWKSFEGRERPSAAAALAVWVLTQRKEEFLALWFTAKDSPQKFLGFWCHVDGEFRFVGWLYVIRTKTGESMLLLPPDAKIQDVIALHKPVPPYPSLARQARIQGTVGLKAVVTGDGAVDYVEVLLGHPLLIQSALDAVRKWRFTPLLVDGQVLDVVVVIEVTYMLSS